MKPLLSSAIVALAASRQAPAAVGAKSTSATKSLPPNLPHEWQTVAATMAVELPRGGATNDSSSSSSSPPSPDKKSSSPQKDVSSSSKKKTRRQSKSGNAKNDPPKTDAPPKNKKSTTSKTAHAKGNSSSDHESSSSSSSSSSTSTMPIVQEILDCQDDYYKVLGLEGTSRQAKAKITEKQIQKAYRKRAVQTHPDKTGGDRRAFDIVAKAYEVLTDDQQRAVYDRFGKAGLDPNGGAGMRGFGGGTGGASSFQDMFQNMFQQQQRQQNSMNRTVRYQIEVSLEDLYKGVTQEILVRPPSRRRSHTHHPISPKRVEVEVPRGALPGQSILISGAMDWDAGETPGDLILVVSPKPHPVFTRKSYDLAMELTITLEEALCGIVARPIRHLDGTEILLESASLLPPNQAKETGNDKAHDSERTPIPIQTGDVQVLKGKGFPKSPRGDEYGDLYIQFKVEMPGTGRPGSKTSTSVLQRLTPKERDQLSALLAKLQGHKQRQQQLNRKKEQLSKGIHSLEAAAASDFGRASGTAKIEPDAEHSHYFDDEARGPFGNGSSTFFSQSFGGPGGGGGTRSFFFGPGGMPGNPFQQPGATGDDGNVECQQM